MKKFLPFFVLLCAVALFAQDRVVAYFPHWAQYSQFKPSDVRYNFVTEVRYGYLTPSDSELLFTDESDKNNFLELVKLAKAAKVKVTVAVGGMGLEEAMKGISSGNLTQAAKKFQSEYGIDAFELDGGLIAAEDLPKLLQLAIDVANAGLSVSIAVPGVESLAGAIGSADLSKIENFSLWFTDDASANDSQVKPNSNTVNNIKVLAAFASAGVPKNKLMPILPFYGKTFYKAKGLGSSHEGVGSGNEGSLPYKDILDKFRDTVSYKVSFDESSKSEVAVSESETIVFNGIPSVKTMAETVKENGYGGIAAFDISGDHREPIVSLLVTVGQVLRPEVDYKTKRRR
ncbi:MAG: glycoside hydrolase family 18 protein [Fibromonadaceae bacterium]|nr:glycoside hydrolase family 18 protein [Fibromonadaceae bacterium]